jgi:hypothetical protein
MAQTTLDPAGFADTILKSILAVWGAVRRDPPAYRGRLFRDFVEPTFRQLRTIHEDYSTNLSRLSTALQRAEQPPRDLVEWFRDVGLKYRADRDQLAVVDHRLRGIDYGKVASGTGSRKQEIAQLLREYVYSLLRYLESCGDHTGLSFYRDFEQSLMRQLRLAEAAASSEDVLRLFYKTDYIQDMILALTKASDLYLPSQWRQVCRAHDQLQSALDFPETTSRS